MLKVADRVKETTTTTGTGDLALAGASTGFRTFNAAFGTGVPCYYCIASPSGAEWEVGIGQLSAAAVLVRSTILGSSNAGAAVNFSAGTKDVFCTAPAAAFGALEIPDTMSADLTVCGLTKIGTAGENVVFGDSCYTKSDGKFWKADANAAGAYPATVMATGTIGANASGVFLRIGQARNVAWNWTVGSLLYLSTTAGAMTQTRPSATDDVVQVLGVCFPNADTVQFQPSLDMHTVV